MSSTLAPSSRPIHLPLATASGALGPLGLALPTAGILVAVGAFGRSGPSVLAGVLIGFGVLAAVAAVVTGLLALRHRLTAVAHRHAWTGLATGGILLLAVAMMFVGTVLPDLLPG